MTPDPETAPGPSTPRFPAGPVPYSERLRRRNAYYAAHTPADGEPRLQDFRHKLRGQLLARKLGFRVPALYWTGQHRIPLHLLPPRVAVKPIWGSFSRGVRLIDHWFDHMAGAMLDEGRLLADVKERTYLAEEFVPGPDGRYGVPVDYKFFVFGDRVPAVQAIDRARKAVAWFDAAWRPRPPVTRTDLEMVDPAAFPAPDCLGRMLEIARAFGCRAGTFVRVDLYASVGGPVFGETALVPAGGKGVQPDADAELGALWDAEFPDAF